MRSRTSVASRSKRSRRPCAHAASRCERTRATRVPGRSNGDEAPAQEIKAEPGCGSPQLDASHDVEAADRARAHPDDSAEGEGAEARVREADHAREAR